MGELDLSSAASSDMTNAVDDVTVDLKNTDGVGDQKETEWINSNWSKYWGYFNTIPELKSAVLMKGIWDVGKGYTADDTTTTILEQISGWGKDTFDDILFNLEVVKRIGGDSFAEVIRGEDGNVINLKPLDPSSIKIIVNRKGIIERYEQINKLSKKGETIHKFNPADMLHFSNNRLADQIHGISDIESMEKTILAEYESFDDIKKIMHHQAKPMLMFKLGTDDPTKIAEFTAKMDVAVNKGENIYVPNDKDAVDFEVIQVNVSSIIFQWRNDIQNKFYRAMGLPLVIFGQAGQTESGGKIEYLAHEQVFEKDQRGIEQQLYNQLGLKIDLIPPVSLLENLQNDEAKDANQGMEIQKADVTAGAVV